MKTGLLIALNFAQGIANHQHTAQQLMYTTSTSYTYTPWQLHSTVACNQKYFLVIAPGTQHISQSMNDQDRQSVSHYQKYKKLSKHAYY